MAVSPPLPSPTAGATFHPPQPAGKGAGRGADGTHSRLATGHEVTSAPLPPLQSQGSGLNPVPPSFDNLRMTCWRQELLPVDHFRDYSVTEQEEIHHCEAWLKPCLKGELKPSAAGSGLSSRTPQKARRSPSAGEGARNRQSAPSPGTRVPGPPSASYAIPPCTCPAPAAGPHPPGELTLLRTCRFIGVIPRLNNGWAFPEERKAYCIVNQHNLYLLFKFPLKLQIRE